MHGQTQIKYSWFEAFAVFCMLYAQTECSETSAYKLQTPDNYPKENIQQNQVFFVLQRPYTAYIAGWNRLHVSASLSHHQALIKNINKCIFNVAYFSLLCLFCTTGLSKKYIFEKWKILLSWKLVYYLPDDQN